MRKRYGRGVSTSKAAVSWLLINLGILAGFAMAHRLWEQSVLLALGAFVLGVVAGIAVAFAQHEYFRKKN